MNKFIFSIINSLSVSRRRLTCRAQRHLNLDHKPHIYSQIHLPQSGKRQQITSDFLTSLSIRLRISREIEMIIGYHEFPKKCLLINCNYQWITMDINLIQHNIRKKLQFRSNKYINIYYDEIIYETEDAGIKM